MMFAAHNYPKIKECISNTPTLEYLRTGKVYEVTKVPNICSYLGDYMYTSNKRVAREIFVKDDTIHMVKYVDKYITSITFHKNDPFSVRIYETYDDNQNHHSYDDEPAIVQYETDGKLYQEYYYKHGKIHRDDGKYAYIKYSNVTQIPVQGEIYIDGVKIRTDRFDISGETIASMTS